MLKDIYRALTKKLSDGGIEGAQYEAQCLIEYVTGYGRASLISHGDDEIDGEKTSQLNSLAEKRLKNYPLQYLIGEWSFMGFELLVGEGVLIPRDDTEVCVQLCMDFLKDRQSKTAVDLCSGSGAIAIALERLGGAQVTAVELSDEAFDFLKKNISLNNSSVKAVKGDVLSCFADFADGSLDLIVSNPPYIKKSDLPTLQAEVQYEPKMALDGGESGYDFYEAIIKNWSAKLKIGGAMVFELGEGQAEYVERLMREQGFENIRTELDLGGCHRAIIGTMLWF